MNSRIQFTTPTRLFVIAFVLLCFGVSPRTQAVNPPPDGGYPVNNTAEGSGALFNLTSGASNTALGYQTLSKDTTGSYNTAEGIQALFRNTTGPQNTATGNGALNYNSNGSFNTADGANTLFTNTSGSDNTAIGASALTFNRIASENTGIGAAALAANRIGSQNTAAGAKALQSGRAHTNVIALGYSAGSARGYGDFNEIWIGNVGTNAGFTIIRIGDVQTATFIAGIFGATVLGDAIPVNINSNERLGTASSSRRFKKEIEPMDKASEAIMALKPVTFHYKSDTTDTPQFGLIAEDVAAVNPDLVVRDKNGEIYTVRYDAVNAMLLNEFLKEHRRVGQQAREMQQQQATIGELKSDAAKEEATIRQLNKEMESVVARLKEHDSRIQKASAHIELSKSFARTTLNNQ
jgi:hypothetical protein